MNLWVAATAAAPQPRRRCCKHAVCDSEHVSSDVTHVVVEYSAHVSGDVTHVVLVKGFVDVDPPTTQFPVF